MLTRFACSTFALCLLSFFAVRPAIAEPRRLPQSLKGQLVNAFDELKAKLAADAELKGRKLRLGKFSGPNLPDSNFELEFENQIKSIFTDLLDDSSDFILSGEYDHVPGEVVENDGLKVIQMVLKVVNRQRRTLQTVIKEINDSSEVSRILGVTVAPPDSKKIDERLEKIDQAAESPKFELRDKTRVIAPGQSDFAVEILRHPGGSDQGKVVTPSNKSGHAFVDLEVTDCFSLMLYNFNRATDVVAKISIDGLDVANEFSEDDDKYPGYVVAKASNHSIPGWLRTAKSSEKNVFQFVINEAGKGAASERKTRGSRGVITVQFFEASEQPLDLPSRSFGEVGKGKPMDVAYTVKEVFLRDSPVSVVSIRYSHQ